MTALLKQLRRQPPYAIIETPAEMPPPACVSGRSCMVGGLVAANHAPMPSTSAVYLYCLVRARDSASGARVPSGLDGATRRQSRASDGPLAGVIATEVPLDLRAIATRTAAARSRMGSRSGRRGMKRVRRAFLAHANATVLPMKLFTMFSSIEQGGCGRRAARRGSIARCAVSLAARSGACSDPTIGGTRDAEGPGRASNPLASGKDGTAFLVARRDARDTARAVRAEAIAAADAAFERLQRLARDVRRRDRRPEAGSNPPLLDAAFLVASDSRARFRAEVRRQSVTCESAGAEMTLTGPWPAYNFVDEAEDRS